MKDFIRGVEEIAAYAKDSVRDLRLSIDGAAEMARDHDGEIDLDSALDEATAALKKIRDDLTALLATLEE